MTTTNTTRAAAYLTKKQINKAIAHTGLTVVGKRGGGSFYFLDADEYVVGRDTVLVCYLHHLPLDLWVAEAERALAEGRQ